VEGATSAAQAFTCGWLLAGKDKRKITTAVARELLGFIWAIGTRAETEVRPANSSLTKAKAKSKNIPKNEQSKNNPTTWNSAPQTRAQSPAAAEASTKENPRLGYRDRLSRTRDNSQRQLPTDHDYAVTDRGISD